MRRKWYDNQLAKKWLNELGDEQYKMIQKIMEDQVALKKAITYGLQVQGVCVGEQAKRKAAQMLNNFDQSLSAATFQIFQESLIASAIVGEFSPQNKKENSMQESQGNQDRLLTEKQVEFALNTRKPMFIDSAKELVTFLEKQNDPKWWLDRKKFNWCVSSFVKTKTEEWYAQHPEKRPEQQQGIQAQSQEKVTPQANAQSEPSVKF